MRRTIGIAVLLSILFAIFMACTREPPPPIQVSWRIEHAPAPYCPCAELLQPVHITARRYHHPHDPVPLIMECQAPEVEAALPRTIEWPEPPLRDFTPTVDAHFDFSEPPPRRYAWLEPQPRVRSVAVDEPPMWGLCIAAFGALLYRRRG